MKNYAHNFEWISGVYYLYFAFFTICIEIYNNIE